MSTEIRARRQEYYALLESTQQGRLDVTLWMRWFLEYMRAAIAAAHHTLARILGKGRFGKRTPVPRSASGNG